MVVNRETVADSVQTRDNRRIKEIVEMSLRLNRNEEEERTIYYKTVAVIHHKGSKRRGNQNSGHYLAYINKNGTWFKCNDSWVKQVHTSEVGSSTAYIVVGRQSNVRVTSDEHRQSREDESETAKEEEDGRDVGGSL